MKKARVILSALAMFFAVGFAVASEFFAPIPGYRFVPAAGGNPARCEQIDDVCDTNGTFTCRVTSSSPILRSVDNPAPNTQCGTSLKRLTPAP